MIKPGNCKSCGGPVDTDVGGGGWQCLCRGRCFEARYDSEQEAIVAWNNCDNTELEACCKLLTDAGISTGHASNFTELVEECIANIKDAR